MRNPDWGIKRICQACHSKYYDLNHTPIVCPKCQVEFDPAAGLKLRSDSSYKGHGGRAKSVFGKAAQPGYAEGDEEAKRDEPEAAEENEEDGEDAEAADDEGALEDVSELGDDKDDLAEVVEDGHDDDR